MKTLAGMLAVFCTASMLNAQVLTESYNRASCNPPTVNDTAFCPPGTYTLSANTTSGAVQWYDQAAGGNPIHSGTTFSPTIYTTTTYYAEALCLDSSIVLPVHNSSFPSLTRGYWFTAPEDFVITEVFVPLDGSTADQSVEIIRFNSGPPTNWPNFSNDFSSLFYANNVPGNNNIQVGIFIQAGDIIGVLGARGGINSYTATGPVSISMAGNSVTLNRMGFQDNIATSQAYDVWTEPSQPIGRVQLFLGVAVDTSARVALRAEILNSPDSVRTETACFGDTISDWGGQFTSDTTLFQIYTNAVGCDSIHYLVVDIEDELDTSVARLVDGSGLYVPAPVGNVFYQWFDCNTNMPIPGADSLFHYPSANGSFSLQIESNSGCTAMSSCYAFTSIGVQENDLAAVNIYPNPTTGIINVQLPQQQQATVRAFNTQGQAIQLKQVMANGANRQYQLAATPGVYILNISTANSSVSKPIVLLNALDAQ